MPHYYILSQFFRKKTVIQGNSLKKDLSFLDLTFMGISAIIGAGIFSTVGKACYEGGPAIVFLFIFTALACGLSALCYAQFASAFPDGGSAYTYTYVSLGELPAWIIGWDLIMEYAIGNIAVAISWSDYLTTFLRENKFNFPFWLSTDWLSAKNQITFESKMAWSTAPQLWGFKIILDLPALLLNMIVTTIIFLGISKAKKSNNILVISKILILTLVITVGFFWVDVKNWIPFAPNGISGILKGISAVFFAYIGFDTISTVAEECKNPQKDIPKAMIASLLICTFLYICLALILTGMVPSNHLNVGDPIAFIFYYKNLTGFGSFMAISALVMMTSVFLVFQLGQPRIWMSMSRDGLLPKKFSAIHPRFKTPYFSTIITGLLVGIPCLFMNLTEVTDLTSIGTLFAFLLVCMGVWLKNPVTTGFKIPYINGKYWIPILNILVLFVLNKILNNRYLLALKFPFETESIIHLIFIISLVIIGLLTYIKNLSLIPALGVIVNAFLLSELGLTNWIRFTIWLGIGLILYLAYGFKNSNLVKNDKQA